MCTEPLSSYFTSTGITEQFDLNCTGLWRGYFGTWEVKDDCLYLVGLHGTLRDGTDASVALFFPDSPEQVFASWYSGKIRVPQGNLLQYVHMGYASIYESDLILTVEKGIIVTKQCIDNRLEENRSNHSVDASAGYGAGAFITFPPKI